MSGGNLFSFFGILGGDRPFSLGFYPNQFEDVKKHVHEEMAGRDNDAPDQFEKILECFQHLIYSL
jgi:hypothetical protein